MDNSRMIALSGFHQKKLPQSVVIIGAGASGLFAARRLRQLGLKQITLLEKEPRVGGKCSTYFDQDEPNIFIERGAGIICLNYGVVIDAMREKNIKTIRMPDIINNSSPIRAYYQSLDLLGKWRFAYRIKQEMWSFGRLVKKYRKSLQKSLPLPEELELPFANCAKKYNFEILSIILKKILTGFGYGDLRDCPTYSVLEYMGYSSIPLSIAGYFFSPFEPRCVQGGMQNFVQRIAEDFDVRTESEVMRIDRKEHVYVSYKNKDGILENIKADALILAVSPKRWMGLLDRSQLIKEELLAIEQLTYYYYPVLVCRLYGFAQSSMIYLQNGFNRETFGRVAFVFSFDSRENLLGGRLCAACINQKLTSAVFEKNDLDLDLIQQELCALPGVIKAEILECKIWDDYFPCLPWNVRVQLEKQQFSQKTQTLYLGGYTLGCFEDLASVAAKATETIDRLFDVKTSLLEKYKRGFRRFMYYLMSGDGVK